MARAVSIFAVLLSAVGASGFDAKTGVFPASIRQALVEKSKQLNPSTNYSSGGWSNRAATVLTPVGPSVYTADRPFYPSIPGLQGVDVGCRQTVIELPSSSGSNKPDLFVHSPVGLDGPMLKAMEELGTVRYVCTPNYEHVKFASVWYQNYKTTADMWGCPGLSERMPEIQWKGEIPAGYRPRDWKGKITSTDPEGIWDTDTLQPLHIDVEKNPFTGRPFFNEVIFWHKPSKTLLTTDLFWNYPASGTPNSEFGRDDSWELAPKVDRIPIGSKLWKFGMDKVYYPFFNSLMVTDKTEYQAIADHILNVWDVETVIPAHGDILRGKDFIRSVLTKYFQLD